MVLLMNLQPTIPEYISDKEETAQRAVNAEALSSWSTCNTNALLNASTSVSVGNSPLNIRS